MCGRFTLRAGLNQLAEQFMLFATDDVELQARYNVAPSQPVAAVRVVDPGHGRQLGMLRWGLVPSWAKEESIGNRLINARAETVATRPSFRQPFRQRRCLVLADGYYEWQQREGGRGKQPFFIHRHDDQPFAMAGLWDRWQSPGGQVLESCVIITTEANEGTRAIHDRMPVILTPEHHDLWLAPQPQDTGELTALLRPYPSEEITAFPVSRLVNNPRNESPDCIRPLAGDSG